jgi:hypothetical protein
LRLLVIGLLLHRARSISAVVDRIEELPELAKARDRRDRLGDNNSRTESRVGHPGGQRAGRPVGELDEQILTVRLSHVAEHRDGFSVKRMMAVVDRRKRWNVSRM